MVNKIFLDKKKVGIQYELEKRFLDNVSYFYAVKEKKPNDYFGKNFIYTIRVVSKGGIDELYADYELTEAGVDELRLTKKKVKD